LGQKISIISVKFELYFVDTSVLHPVLLFTEENIIMEEWNPNLTTVITIKQLLDRFVFFEIEDKWKLALSCILWEILGDFTF